MKGLYRHIALAAVVAAGAAFAAPAMAREHNHGDGGHAIHNARHAVNHHIRNGHVNGAHFRRAVNHGYGMRAGRHGFRPAFHARFHGNFARLSFHDRTVWRGGHWFHGRSHGRFGWWWIVPGGYYFYDAPVYPYPGYISTGYYGDDAAYNDSDQSQYDEDDNDQSDNDQDNDNDEQDDNPY